MSASSPDVTLAALKLRKGARFAYEYDLNIPWRHEVRIEENRLDAALGKAHPTCTAGDGVRRGAERQRHARSKAGWPQHARTSCGSA